MSVLSKVERKLQQGIGVSQKDARVAAMEILQLFNAEQHQSDDKTFLAFTQSQIILRHGMKQDIRVVDILFDTFINDSDKSATFIFGLVFYFGVFSRPVNTVALKEPTEYTRQCLSLYKKCMDFFITKMANYAWNEELAIPDFPLATQSLFSYSNLFSYYLTANQLTPLDYLNQHPDSPHRTEILSLLYKGVA